MRTVPTSKQSASQEFLRRQQDHAIGILHGWDRLRLRGTLRQLYCPRFMEAYLSAQHLMLKQFGTLVQSMSRRVKAATESLAEKFKRPLVYVPSSGTSKEAVAKAMAQRDKVREGLIGILSCVEPCHAYSLRGNRASKHLELRMEWRKCLHFYFYLEHPKFGFMHFRLQSWFPFQIDVGLNGRHWQGRATGPEEQRRVGRTTRNLALLRAHGLVRKVSGTHRYVVTEKGRMTITALLAARQANVETLTKMAA